MEKSDQLDSSSANMYADQEMTSSNALSDAERRIKELEEEVRQKEAAANKAAFEAQQEYWRGVQEAKEEAKKKAAETAPAAVARTHTVVSGDTLSGIAAAYYSNAGRWQEIYEANKEVIGGNPNLIRVGQVLRIP